MVFIGYKIIGMPSALLLSSITFILAFIPFVGFLISMIIPYIIAITIGTSMIIKLHYYFYSSNIKRKGCSTIYYGKSYENTSYYRYIFSCRGSTLGGPIAAFCIVPIYSLLRLF